MYTAYTATILIEGVPKTVHANWAGVMNSIYDTIGEDAAKRCAAVLGELQAEMFFGQDVNMSIVDSENKYRINVKTIKSNIKDDDCV